MRFLAIFPGREWWGCGWGEEVRDTDTRTDTDTDTETDTGTDTDTRRRTNGPW
jgi:hypothetical protein